MAAFTANDILALPVALQGRAVLEYPACSSRVPPAPFLWAGRQQVKEKAGKNKGYVCYLKERKETELSRMSPQAG